MKKYLIGTDIGTSGTKSILTDLDGRIISSSLIEYGILQPQALWAEQWPDVWVDAVKNSIKNVLENSGVNPSKIAGIAISGLYGGSGVPCDSDLNPVRPCIIWMDQRTAEESLWVEEQIGLERLFSITGNGLDPYFGFTKILWIKNHEPGNWGKINQFLPPNAYVIYKLTGEVAIDYSSAGNIGGIFDLRTRDWSSELMEEMGIPKALMPAKIVDSSAIVGGLSPVCSRELRLPTGVPIIAGGIDCIVATLSAGVYESGQHVAVIGTSINWGMVHENFPVNRRLVTMPFIEDPKKKYYTYGGASTAGALPKWFKDNFGDYEKESGAKDEKSAYVIFDEMAEKIKPGSEGLIVLPYFMGERSPIWDTNARGLIFGLTLSHSKAHVYRAILESVAYSLRHIMETGETSIKYGDECILVGGVTKSKLWKQIFADVTGMNIISPQGNIEAPLGDALLAGVGTGVLKDYSVIKSWINFNNKIEPNQGRHKLYSEYFQEYKNLYPVLAPNMKELVRIAKQEL